VKRILITGVNGFVGSHLVDRLLQSEPETELFGLKKVNARLRNIKDVLGRITLVEGDLTDPLSMWNLIEQSMPDEIYHLGALSWVGPSWNMPSAYLQVNAIGTVNLLEAVRRARLDPRILVSCTPEEFGDVAPGDLPITEHSAVAPVNHYAASKVAQDAVCRSYFASYGMRIVRTRAFNHEGPRRDINGALASFAYQIARIERGLQPPVVQVGNLEARRSFTHVKDIVRAYQMAMARCTPGELYLIGSQHVYTIRESLERLIALSTAGRIEYEVAAERIRPTELRYLVGDCSKFRNLTGWRPEIPFEGILNDVLDYWREFIDRKMY